MKNGVSMIISIPNYVMYGLGVDPLVDVEAAGRKMGFTGNRGNFHSISLGQGQDLLAENALRTAAAKGTGPREQSPPP